MIAVIIFGLKSYGLSLAYTDCWRPAETFCTITSVFENRLRCKLCRSARHNQLFHVRNNLVAIVSKYTAENKWPGSDIIKPLVCRSKLYSFPELFLCSFAWCKKSMSRVIGKRLTSKTFSIQHISLNIPIIGLLSYVPGNSIHLTFTKGKLAECHQL